jgi:hypothetical protein
MKLTKRQPVTPGGHLADAFQAITDLSNPDALARCPELQGSMRLKPRCSSQRCKERLVKPGKFQQKLASKPLSVEQENAADVLWTGKTDREAAEAVGVSRWTVQQWRTQHPLCMATFEQKRAEVGAWRQSPARS